MASEKIKLFAPNSLPIIGARMSDGSIIEFEYSYGKNISIYTLSDRSNENPNDKNELYALVDSNGKNWDSNDVEFYTLFQHKRGGSA